MKINFCLWSLVLAFAVSACGISPTPDALVLTPPAISVQITDEYCPSIEIKLGMYIAWTNADDVDHLLIIERVDEQGVVVESGGMPLFQPGTTFSILLTEAGQYTYYCSLDRKQFGIINVLPDTPTPVIENSTQALSTPQCVETLMPPIITEIQPAQPSAGNEITVIGNGGFIQDSCGGVNESARSFTLYLDDEPVGDFICYVDDCELKFRLPDALTEGPHCLSTQKDVCEFSLPVVLQ